jgi:multiple sugar transport system substrate-binding protein
MLIQDEPFQGLVDKGLIADLTALVQRDMNELRAQIEDYWPTQWEVVQYKGRIYGMPGQVGGGYLIYYNQELFDQAGLPYPEKNWTWDQFIQAGRRTNRDVDGNGVNDIWGLQTAANFLHALAWIWGAGGDILNAERTAPVVNTTQTIEGFRFYQNLVREYGITQVSPTPNWLAGQAAMFIQGNWAFGRNLQEGRFRWDVAHFPRHPSTGLRASRVTWNIVTMNPETKYPKEVWDFIKYFSSIEASELLITRSNVAYPPSMSASRKWSLARRDTPQNEMLMADVLFEDGRLQPINPLWQEMETILNKHMGRLWRGEASPEQTAAVAQEELTILFSQLYPQNQ